MGGIRGGRAGVRERNERPLYTGASVGDNPIYDHKRLSIKGLESARGAGGVAIGAVGGGAVDSAGVDDAGEGFG